MSRKKRDFDKRTTAVGEEPREEVEERVSEMVVGEPIPIDEFPVARRGGRTIDHWLELCRRIPEGFAQQVKGFSCSAARNAVSRLIKMNLLPNTYIVRCRGGRKQKQSVYIIHLESEK